MKEIANNQLAELITSIDQRLVSMDDRLTSTDERVTSMDSRLTVTVDTLANKVDTLAGLMLETRGELHAFIGFVKDNMVTHDDLRMSLAATEYRIMDRMDRGFAKRDYEIGDIKSSIRQFHPTAFPEPKTTS